MIVGMDILSSRVLLRPVDLPAVQTFYRDVLNLGVAREFGSGEHAGVVFFLAAARSQVHSGAGSPR